MDNKFSKCCVAPLKEGQFCPICNEVCLESINIEKQHINEGYYFVSGVESIKDAERALFIMEMQLGKAFPDDLYFDIQPVVNKDIKGFNCYLQ